MREISPVAREVKEAGSPTPLVTCPIHAPAAPSLTWRPGQVFTGEVKVLHTCWSPVLAANLRRMGKDATWSRRRSGSGLKEGRGGGGK